MYKVKTSELERLYQIYLSKRAALDEARRDVEHARGGVELRVSVGENIGRACAELSGTEEDLAIAMAESDAAEQAWLNAGGEHDYDLDDFLDNYVGEDF
jgi:hypothetical protein